MPGGERSTPSAGRDAVERAPRRHDDVVPRRGDHRRQVRQYRRVVDDDRSVSAGPRLLGKALDAVPHLAARALVGPHVTSRHDEGRSPARQRHAARLQRERGEAIEVILEFAGTLVEQGVAALAESSSPGT
jgi:hypothetical protein